ncbi:MAG: tRNA (adenosine(37)-N6)-threonylcarbamoyltransferase complex dimerization subunit type 1 TsaB [Ignavibacteriales bacterium]|nr:tRNA (adenosine(37)-N6)-threonylcarbamoyltransferase complex dimerization subunit type 1 TsaB [Ignavibacteriales bacterium]
MILAIETATSVCGIAIVQANRILGSRSTAEKNMHSERLMPMVDELLSATGATLRELTAIAVSIGPGSFTGLRIGLSTAKGMALALQIPIIPIQTLDALAQQMLIAGKIPAKSTLCPLIDARRDEAFYAFYRHAKGRVSRISEPAIAPAAAILVQAASFQNVYFGGDGTHKLLIAAAGSGSFTYRPEILCSPETVALLAERSEKSLSPEEYAMVEPMYLRDFFTQ